MIFIRGDRSVTTSSSPATTTVLRAKGQLYTASAGQLPPSSSVAAKFFESVGNPYASAIDFTQISKPDRPLLTILSTFGIQRWPAVKTWWIPDHQQHQRFQTCAWRYDKLSFGFCHHHYTIRQAFFIHATGAGSGGTISFTEAAKSRASSMVFRGNGEQSSLRAVLFAGSRLADANLVVFHETYTNAYTGEDARN